VELEPERSLRVAESAVSYARERGFERTAVIDERALLRDALKHTMGEARLPEIKDELQKRIASDRRQPRSETPLHERVAT
jgi:hypothetical protein